MSAELLSFEEACPTCGASIDVTGFEPLARIGCPACGQEMVVSRLLGEYELLEVMGRGGMGVVYRARDRGLDRMVALKVLRSEQAQGDFLEKLEQEAAVTASINHPNVVKVFTTGTVLGRFYLAMELVDKGTLDDLIELQGRVAEAQALEIATQIAQGLRAANQHGLIHRDVKPGNILFSDAHTAKIVDFGLAILEEAATGTGEIWGTPYYVSPERLDQKAEDFRSDMYSLGATIFHAIAGRPPFEAEDATMVALKHLKSEAVSLQAFAPWISGSTAFVINRTLMKDPQARYGSYDELIEHLEYARSEMLSGNAQPAEKKRVVLETAEDRKRWGYLTSAMIGLVLLMMLGGGAILFFGIGQTKTYSGPPETASVGAEGKDAQSYETARQLLLHEKPAEAAPLFQALASAKGTPEPLAQWSALQAGLSWLVAGKGAESRTAFGGLQTRPYGGKDAKLAAFFKRIGEVGGSAQAVEAEKVKGADPRSYESLVLLVAGLKDWELEQFDQGAAILREFKEIDPHGGFAWLTQYRELASDFLSDYSDYRGALALTRNAKTAPELQNAVKTLRKVKADLKHQGTLSMNLEKAAAQAEADGQKLAKLAAAQVEAEKKALAAARDKAAGLCREWKMGEAKGLVAHLKISNGEVQRDQRVLEEKIGWLEAFKETLIKNLSAGYAGALKTKDGKELTAKVSKAGENEVTLEGGPAKKWADLAPASVLAMATSFIQPDAAPERSWTAGIYAVFSGQKGEAKTLLHEAAKAPEWADRLPLVFPKLRANPPKTRPLTASPTDLASLADPAPDLFAAPSAPLIPTLESTDIGMTGTVPPGSTTVDERTGVISLRGGGADIFKNADSFRFAHRRWKGDGQLVARIEAVERGRDDGAKGGIMFREGIGTDARMVYLCATNAPAVLFEVRKESKAAIVEKRDASLHAPCWVRLVRAGHTFTASVSADGQNWKQIGAETVEVGEETQAGLAVSAHGMGALSTTRAEMVVFGR